MKTLIILTFTFVFLLFTFYFNPPAFAQIFCNLDYSNRVQNGLISTPQIISGSKLGGTSRACAIDPKAAFAPYKVPSYNDLESLYYTQSKANKTDATPGGNAEANQGTLRSSLNNYDVILFKGDLRLGNVGGSPKTAVVFVEGNLFFDQNFTLGDNNSGLVFVVKGNVNIAQSVTRIDAIIISEGVICTAYNGSACPSTNTPNLQQLVINGSLISLNPANPIKFKRSLADNNSNPAEKINHQVKYLVILRNLMSDTFQRWSEITVN